jgi:hypothetical protein
LAKGKEIPRDGHVDLCFSQKYVLDLYFSRKHAHKLDPRDVWEQMQQLERMRNELQDSASGVKFRIMDFDLDKENAKRDMFCE